MMLMAERYANSIHPQGAGFKDERRNHFAQGTSDSAGRSKSGRRAVKRSERQAFRKELRRGDYR